MWWGPRFTSCSMYGTYLPNMQERQMLTSAVLVGFWVMPTRPAPDRNLNII